MELRCPSCGNAHNTDDYPGAFEIQCSCGYSILVPDEQSLSENIPIDDTHGFTDAPMAIDSEEDANRISVEADVDPADPDSSGQSSHVSSLGMTDPEELPEEMPYDPFELSTESSDNDDGEPFPSFEINDTPEGEAEENFSGNDEEGALGYSDSDINEDSDASNDGLNEELAETAEPSEEQVPSQEVVSKVQWASLGQTKGSLFSLQFSGELSAQDRAGILDSLEDGLILSPWLKEVFSLSRKELEDKVSERHLSKVPELLALQIYIYCLENRIPCEVALDT